MGRFQLDVDRLTEERGSNSLVFLNCAQLLTKDAAIDNRFVPKYDSVLWHIQINSKSIAIKECLLTLACHKNGASRGLTSF